MNNKFVVLLNYGDIFIGSGGTDRYALSLGEQFKHYGYSVINLFPVDRISKFIKLNAKKLWGVCIDEKFFGIVSTEQLIDDIHSFIAEGRSLKSFFINHFMGVDIPELQTIINCIKGDLYVFLHDYYTICPHNLTDSNNLYCGSSFPSTDKCGACCKFSEETSDRAHEIRNFLKNNFNRMIFIAPSEVVNKEWSKTYTALADQVRVIPHQKLVGCYRQKSRKEAETQKIRIAYVGDDRPNKGYEYWKDAVEEINHTGYELYFFGKHNESLDGVKYVQIDFKKNKNDMIDKLRENQIDCAILWSTLPETYSFTYFESFASNCFVLTNSSAGNIAAMVEKNKNGMFAADVNDLKKILQDEIGLREQLKEFRARDICGPLTLEDNDELLKTVDSSEALSVDVSSKNHITIKRSFLLSLLYQLYRTIKK